MWHPVLTEIGLNSWKNGRQYSLKIHHCFYEHGATVAKRKENNAAALHLSHWISWFVNNSIIRGYNDHQNVSKFSPYRVGQFVTKNWAYFFVKLDKWSYIQGLWRLMTLCNERISHHTRRLLKNFLIFFNTALLMCVFFDFCQNFY